MVVGMSKHKHAEMIKAKADNMELVVFCEGNGKWVECVCDFGQISWWEDKSYFLCLPQHNENGQCLHWLNGVTIEVKSKITNGRWSECVNHKIPTWRNGIGWMRSDAEYRIKHKKEKRWIAVHKNGYTTSPAYKTKHECIICHFDGHRSNMVGWQFIEIEVEA